MGIFLPFLLCLCVFGTVYWVEQLLITDCEVIATQQGIGVKQYKYHNEKMSTKDTKAAQRTQRRDFDKAMCLDFFYFGCKALSTSNFVPFVLPLGSLC